MTYFYMDKSLKSGEMFQKKAPFALLRHNPFMEHTRMINFKKPKRILRFLNITEEKKRP